LESSAGGAEGEAPLFHRFFCRLREVIYSCFNFYLHTASFGAIKEFLIAVNKEILAHQATAGARQLLMAIRGIVNRIALGYGINAEALEEARKGRVEYPLSQPVKMVVEGPTEGKKVPETQILSSKS
jgi:hypothetical protein